MSSFSQTLRSFTQPLRTQPRREARARVQAPGFSYFPPTRTRRAPVPARIHVAAAPAPQLPRVRNPPAGPSSSVSQAISASSSVLDRANGRDVLSGLSGSPRAPTRTPSPPRQHTPSPSPPASPAPLSAVDFAAFSPLEPTPSPSPSPPASPAPLSAADFAPFSPLERTPSPPPFSPIERTPSPVPSSPREPSPFSDAPSWAPSRGSSRSPNRDPSPDPPSFTPEPIKKVHFYAVDGESHDDADVVETRYYDKKSASTEFIHPEDIPENYDIKGPPSLTPRENPLYAIQRRFEQTFNVQNIKAKSPATLITSFFDEGVYFQVKDAHTDSQPHATWEAGSKKPHKRVTKGQLRNVGTVDEMFPDDRAPHRTCEDCKDAKAVGGFGTGRWSVRCEYHEQRGNNYRNHNIKPGTKRELRRRAKQDSFWTKELLDPKYTTAYPKWKGTGYGR